MVRYLTVYTFIPLVLALLHHTRFTHLLRLRLRLLHTGLPFVPAFVHTFGFVTTRMRFAVYLAGWFRLYYTRLRAHHVRCGYHGSARGLVLRLDTTTAVCPRLRLIVAVAVAYILPRLVASWLDFTCCVPFAPCGCYTTLPHRRLVTVHALRTVTFGYVHRLVVQFVARFVTVAVGYYTLFTRSGSWFTRWFTHIRCLCTCDRYAVVGFCHGLLVYTLPVYAYYAPFTRLVTLDAVTARC